jgi:hypothetical protein
MPVVSLKSSMKASLPLRGSLDIISCQTAGVKREWEYLPPFGTVASASTLLVMLMSKGFTCGHKWKCQAGQAWDSIEL